MGMSEFNDIPYNLAFFLQSQQLDFLAEEFNETKINYVCHASLIVMPLALMATLGYLSNSAGLLLSKIF
jgi:hypothetical protein